MNVDQYISSGILELYALHALPSDQMIEVEDMIEQHPRIRDELDGITEGLKKYAENYAPVPSVDLYDKIIARIHVAPPVKTETTKVEIPVIPIKDEKPIETKRETTPVKQ